MTVSLHRVIAIDGPAASGKSSVARQLARQVGFAYVNSGAMYRAIAWHVLQREIDPNDAARVSRVGFRVPHKRTFRIGRDTRLHVKRQSGMGLRRLVEHHVLQVL